MDELTERYRFAAIDSTRGVIIVLMILEHSRQILSGIIVRELPGIDPVNGLSLGAASIRILSHLCAPGFFFLLGASAVLASRKTPLQVFRRGLLLMALQITVVNLGWALPYLLRAESPAAAGPPLYLGVLFSLGCAAIAVGAVQRLAPLVTVLIALSLIISVSLFFSEQTENGVSGLLVFSVRGRIVEVPYPLLPWTAVALIGTAFAKAFLVPREGQERGRVMQQPVVVLAFLLTGFFGIVFSLLMPWSFHKYPPSLGYLCFSILAIALLIHLFHAVPALNISWLQTIGRHPLLIYVLHLYLIGLVAVKVHSDDAMLAMGVAGAVTVFCFAMAWIYESSPLSESRRNVFDTYSHVYDLFMGLFALYRPEEVSRILPARSAGRLLDIAGGTGFLAVRLQSRFAQVVLIDLSEPMLTIAQKRGLAGVRGAASVLPFASNSFSAVICTDALHHIKKTDATIREMSRVLEPGGRVVIQEFHIKGVIGWLCFLLERLCVDRSQFIKPVELEILMARHGFSGTTRPISRIGYIYEGYWTPKEESPCPG